MAEPLKNRYNQAFFQNLLQTFQRQGHLQDEQRFLSKIFDENWEEKELKDRMRHITVVLHDELALPYAEALQVLKAVAAQQEPDFLPMFFPDFVEVYGLVEDWNTASIISRPTESTAAKFL